MTYYRNDTNLPARCFLRLTSSIRGYIQTNYPCIQNNVEFKKKLV